VIRLQSADGKLFVDASPRDTKNIKLIAGSRYRKDRDVWECPLNLATFTAIRKMYGMNLNVAESALRAEKKLEHSAHLQEVARKDYSVIAKEPRLYSFQNAGVRFLGKGKQVLLADEMGTGKTVQALTTLELANAFPALIVCTNSMKHKWAEEVQTWTSATPVVVEGTASKRRKLIASCQELDKFVVVINYESLRLHSKLGSFGNTVTSAEESKTKELNEIDFVTVIADEVHKAKEPKAKQTRALWGVSKGATYRFGLTGTPIMNNPDDLWSIMHFVCPDEWLSRSRFRQRYCHVSAGWHGGLENLGLIKQRIPELDVFLQPRMIRRTKAEVLPDLPEKTFDTRRIPMTSKQAKSYKQMVEYMIAEVENGLLMAADPLSALGRLRYFASAFVEFGTHNDDISMRTPSNKLMALKDILEEGGTPLVVYAESRRLIEFLDRELSELYKTGLLTGKVLPQQRKTNIDAFQDGKLDILLATTGAGAEGITLTAANRLVVAQESWSNTANKQAHDRIHRIGQERNVQIITLISEDTVDETVHSACSYKEEQLQRLVRDPDWYKSAMTGDV
jgi:SNF2 family DNA or RNA helicase